jgi:hypothetical protein
MGSQTGHALDQRYRSNHKPTMTMAQSTRL